MRALLKITLISVTVFLLAACDREPAVNSLEKEASLAPDEQGFSGPTKQTIVHNRSLRTKLAEADQSDFEQARRGLIASPQALVVNGVQGREAWNMAAYDFIQGEAPDTVNPSLWRQAQLNNIHGLFEVICNHFRGQYFQQAGSDETF